MYNFTILPLRILLSLLALLHQGICRLVLRRPLRNPWLPCFPSDLLRGLLLAIVCLALQQIDASRVYHSIRGQSIIKLYVIFNVFEVFDKLCCSFGLDILESFFSQRQEPSASSEPVRLHPVLHYFLTICYVCKLCEAKPVVPLTDHPSCSHPHYGALFPGGHA